MKNKSTTAVLALFLGGLGIHRFYLKQIGLGILYILFCWTFIPSIIGIIDGIVFFAMSEKKFNSKYNSQIENKSNSSYQNKNSEILNSTIVENKQEIVNVELLEEIKEVVELKTIEKLQFKKFISEQSGMNISEIDNYIESISEEEKEELIDSFKSHNQNEIRKQEVVSKPQTQIIPTIQIIKDTSDQPSCPKCKSKQVTYNKKGFGFGKALVGGVLTGGIGLLAGGIGSSKIKLTCLQCGKTWTR